MFNLFNNYRFQITVLFKINIYDYSNIYYIDKTCEFTSFIVKICFLHIRQIKVWQDKAKIIYIPKVAMKISSFEIK